MKQCKYKNVKFFYRSPQTQVYALEESSAEDVFMDAIKTKP